MIRMVIFLWACHEPFKCLFSLTFTTLSLGCQAPGFCAQKMLGSHHGSEDVLMGSPVWIWWSRGSWQLALKGIMILTINSDL